MKAIRKASVVFFAISLFILASCEKSGAEMSLDEKEHDFGTIKQGDKVTHDFKFSNTGDADLLISDARASCGCTVPEYPKTPVKPGETGIIKVSFNSAGKSGEVEKTVTLECNNKKGRELLKIKANIEVPQQGQTN